MQKEGHLKMIEIKLQATSKDKNESESISLHFDDSEIELLKLYLCNCNRLETAQIFSDEFPKIKNIRWTSDTWITFEITDFKYSQVCELLHLARPIFLSEEPASFEKTQAIFGKKSKGTALAKHLKILRNNYERGDYQPYFQIEIGDTKLFHDKTLRFWLNGIEYHQDSDKTLIVKKLEESLTENAVRGIFVSQLSGRIRAIFLLAQLVKLVVDKTEG